MISVEDKASDQQETSFNEVPRTPPDKHVIVPTENFSINDPEILQNQVAVPFPNIIVRQLSESSDDWSSSESDVTQGQLVEHTPNGINQPLDLFGNGTKLVNTFTDNTISHPTFTDQRIFKGPVTVHQNVYCCSSTFFDDLKSCMNKRCIGSFIATSLGVSILIVLCTWLSNSNITKVVSPETPISSTSINSDNLLSTKDSSPTSVPTFFSDQDIHVSTDVLSNESTTFTNGQKEEKNEIVEASNPLRIITRAEWDAARPLKPLTKLKVLPASRVIISETSTESCDITEKCTKLIREIQRLNPVTCPDIAYNFLVGGDGQIYEGRGWDIEGNVAPYFDHESINIAFIGNFSLFTPPEKQVKAALKLIQFGVENNDINMFFKLNGKRQLTYFSQNPGDKLYNIITKWQQWKPGIIGIHNKVSDNEYNQTISYLNMVSGTKLNYIPKRGRN